jgi:hypothetical protein
VVVEYQTPVGRRRDAVRGVVVLAAPTTKDVTAGESLEMTFRPTLAETLDTQKLRHRNMMMTMIKATCTQPVPIFVSMFV